MEGLIEQLHSITNKAVAVGFGVSGPEQVTLSLTRCQACWLNTDAHNRTKRIQPLAQSFSVACRQSKSCSGERRASLWAVLW